jgi:hypothetical protein
MTSAIVFGRSRSASGAAGMVGVKRSVTFRAQKRLAPGSALTLGDGAAYIGGVRPIIKHFR